MQFFSSEGCWRSFCNLGQKMKLFHAAATLFFHGFCAVLLSHRCAQMAGNFFSHPNPSPSLTKPAAIGIDATDRALQDTLDREEKLKTTPPTPDKEAADRAISICEEIPSCQAPCIPNVIQQCALDSEQSYKEISGAYAKNSQSYRDQPDARDHAKSFSGRRQVREKTAMIDKIADDYDKQAAMRKRRMRRKRAEAAEGAPAKSRGRAPSTRDQRTVS